MAGDWTEVETAATRAAARAAVRAAARVAAAMAALVNAAATAPARAAARAAANGGGCEGGGAGGGAGGSEGGGKGGGGDGGGDGGRGDGGGDGRGHGGSDSGGDGGRCRCGNQVPLNALTRRIPKRCTIQKLVHSRRPRLAGQTKQMHQNNRKLGHVLGRSKGGGKDRAFNLDRQQRAPGGWHAQSVELGAVAGRAHLD